MEDQPKPFLDHLEELRFRLIRALLALALGMAAVYPSVDGILEFLARPVGRFVFLAPTEAFFVRLKVALFGGAILAAPVILYQAWKFVVLALTPLQRRSLTFVLAASYLLFLAGFSLGFFVLVPAGVKFLLGYASRTVVPYLSVETFVDFVGTLCLVMGAVFQMPLAAWFGGRVGLVQPGWLAEQRRYAVLVIYALGALLTPGPDPVTAMLLALPTYILYEASIISARWGARLGAHY